MFIVPCGSTYGLTCGVTVINKSSTIRRYSKMSQFGDCPECGKRSLIILGTVCNIVGVEIGIKVKCINCGYEKVVEY